MRQGPFQFGVASDLLASGRWLTPRAAADALGCTMRELNERWRYGAVRRRAIAPNRYLYEVPTVRA